jgi:MFS family permease
MRRSLPRHRIQHHRRVMGSVAHVEHHVNRTIDGSVGYSCSCSGRCADDSVAVRLLTIAIVGLWAGAVYEPTAIVFLSRQAGMELPEAAKMASYGTGLLSIGTILGCIAAPWLAERLGRRSTLALYYFGMMVTIALAFGWAFYLPTGSALPTFMAVLFFLGVFGGNFAIFSLWLPELFGTEARATAFAFCTSIGRFIGAGVNFGLAGAVAAMGTLGTPIALTSIAFAIGLLIIPFAHETRGETLPE